jgi:elongation factor Ts
MTISAKEVKELRDRTGAGMMECKSALTGGERRHGGGDRHPPRARRGQGGQARASREAREGAIGSYIHMGGKIGVLVEVNCETDFVAKNDAFQQLVRDIAMHIAAANPVAIRREDFPTPLVERERERLPRADEGVGQAGADLGQDRRGQDRQVLPGVDAARAALREEPGPDGREQLITEVSAKTGEKIEVRRFTRYALGE